ESQLHSNYRGSNSWPTSRILTSSPRVGRTARRPARALQNARAARRLKGTNCPSRNWAKFLAEQCLIRARADKSAVVRIDRVVLARPVFGRMPSHPFCRFGIGRTRTGAGPAGRGL